MILDVDDQRFIGHVVRSLLLRSDLSDYHVRGAFQAIFDSSGNRNLSVLIEQSV